MSTGKNTPDIFPTQVISLAPKDSIVVIFTKILLFWVWVQHSYEQRGGLMIQEILKMPTTQVFDLLLGR